MADGAVRGHGRTTVNKTGPGVKASKTVTVANLIVTDQVLITPTSDLPIVGQRVASFYVTKAAGSFTIHSVTPQLLKDVTFDYLVIEKAA
jgi:hypothetical protein